MNSQSDTTITIIAGLAGVGKTTIGKRLAKNLNQSFLDKDTIANGFTKQMLKDQNIKNGSRHSKYYDDVINNIEYKTLMNIAVENANLNISSIVVAPFLKQLTDHKAFEQITKIIPHTVVLKIVWVHANSGAQLYRLVKRDYARDIPKIQDWDNYTNTTGKIIPPMELKDQLYYEFDNNNENIDITKLTKWVVS